MSNEVGFASGNRVMNHNNDVFHIILSFFVGGSNASVALTVVRYALAVLLEIGLAEHAVRVTIKILRVFILQHAFFLLRDVVFDIAATGDPWSDDRIGRGHALEIRHVVIFVVLFIVSLLFYLLVHAWSDLFGRPLRHSWVLVLVCFSSLGRSQQFPVLLFQLSLSLLQLSLPQLESYGLFLILPLSLHKIYNLLRFQPRKRKQFELISSCYWNHHVLFRLPCLCLLPRHLLYLLFGEVDLRREGFAALELKGRRRFWAFLPSRVFILVEGHEVAFFYGLLFLTVAFFESILWVLIRNVVDLWHSYWLDFLLFVGKLHHGRIVLKGIVFVQLLRLLCKCSFWQIWLGELGFLETGYRLRVFPEVFFQSLKVIALISLAI